MLKRTLKILWLTAVAITAVVFACVLAVQTPQVQTFFTQKAVGGLSDRIEGTVEFEKIHFKPFNTLVIRNLSIIDDSPEIEGADTLFRSEYIIVRLSLRGLSGGHGIRLNSVYINDAQLNLAIKDKSVNLMRMFGLKKAERQKPDKGNELFAINRVNITDMRFTLKMEGEKTFNYRGYGMNWNDLDVRSININARKLLMTGKQMSGILDFLSFNEKSGYVCNAISGRTMVGNGKAVVRNFRLSDPWSEISIPEYTMMYGWGRNFKDYVHKVHMYGDIAHSELDFRTLAFFAPGLDKVSVKMGIEGKVAGTVSDLNLSGMKITTAGGARLNLDGRVTGLPEIPNLWLDADIADLSCTTADVASFMSSLKTSRSIGAIADGALFKASGNVKGRINDLRSDLKVAVDSGYVHAQATVANLLSKTHHPTISATAISQDFDIGRIVGTDFVRQCSMETSVKASFTQPGFKGMTAKIDSLKVSRLNLNGYDYSGIAAVGRMETKEFDGRIICNDPNLNFLLQGIFSLSPKTNNALYKFYANIGYADLNALNFDKRGVSKISLRTIANFNKIGQGDLLGGIEVENIVLENKLGKHDIGSISLNSHTSENLYRMTLISDFATASYSGSGSFGKFISDVKDITAKRELPALFRDTLSTYENDRYYFSFKNKDTRSLMAYLMPGMYLADSTDLEMRVDSSGIFNLNLTSPRIAYNGNYIRNMQFNINNRDDVIDGKLESEVIRISTVDLENSRIQIFGNDNFVGLGYDYENTGDMINRGEIITTARITGGEDDKPHFNVNFLPSRIFLNSSEWSINSSTIDIGGGVVDVQDCRFTNEDQVVSINGGLSSVQHDTLDVRLERFNIDILNSLLGEKFEIAGAATGIGRIISAPGNKKFTDKSLLLGFSCEETTFAGAPVGTLRLGSEWNEGLRRFDIIARNELNGAKTFDIAGNYTPSMKKLEMKADLDRFDISYVKPFTESIFSDISGHISGELMAEGPFDELVLSSRDMRIDDSELRIAFTNVPYNASGTFHVDGEGVHFDRVSIKDRHGNSGSVTGGIALGGFKDIRFDTHINVVEMECLDLKEDAGQVFYGNIFGTGNLHLTGRASDIKMNIDAATAGNGQLHIPLKGSATAVSSDLLTFKEEEKVIYIDPYEEMMQTFTKAEKRSSNLTVNARVAATPGVEAFLEIDKASGNVIRGTGSGLLDLEVSNGVFDIVGDYNISAGNYRFVVQGLAFRDFSIQDGSSVKFNGDIMDSDLNIDAIYKTKTSLSTLIADTTSVATRRTVECGINISDKIRNPRLAFSINIPDIDPTVKSRVESALSTEDKVQKQFLSLIVFNNFLPDEQSGIVNNTSMLYSTVSEIVYNQLNNILQKLDIPLDLGLNYQANDRGDDFFDVAVSTQLFNNRVVVNGNIGNRQYGTSSESGRGVAGDIDIEIKLDRMGFLRLNLFSHSSDQYTNYLDNSQRNGVGLAYQQEFNTFKEFFKNLFTGKKKREERAAAEAEAGMVQERKRIKIESDD